MSYQLKYENITIRVKNISGATVVADPKKVKRGQRNVTVFHYYKK